MSNANASGAVQTSVATQPDMGAPGLIYDTAFTDKISKVAVGVIPFGAMVVMSGETCTLPSASGDITGLNIGIAVRDGLKPSGVSGSPAATPGGYADGDIVSVLIKGRAWVALEDSATAGNQPYVRYSGTNPAGGYSSASDSGHNVQAAGVRFFTTAAASLAVVSLNMPQ